MQTLKEAVEGYMLSVYTTVSFLTYQKDQQRRKQLMLDTSKCVAIGTAMFLTWNFGKGKTHYLKYLLKGVQGAGFGLAYSFYFTANKVELWRTDDLYAESLTQSESL